ncbi:MAG: hypothetical protein ACLGIA_11440 [Actinomycetes bacterium]
MEFSAHGTTDATLDEAGQGGAVETATYSVEFVRSGHGFPSGEDDSVLDAAYAAGPSPLSSCGEGVFGTCRTADGTRS